MKNIEILKCRKLDNYHSNDFFSELFARAKKSVVKTLTGIPPLAFTADGTPLIDLLISGNEEHSGTPTPDNPVMPQGCGNKTANLFDETYPNIDSSLHYLAINVGNGDFTLSTTCSRNQSGACLFFLAGNVSSGARTENNGVWGCSETSYGTMTRTQTAVNGYVTIAYRSLSTDLNPVNEDTMLNAGSTALPYEPFGVKIPISSADTTTNIYLGEVQTTRQIKKLVLDGTEGWNEGTSNYYIFIDVSGRGKGIPKSTALSTHTESGVVVYNDGTALFFKKSVFVHSSLADFKTYLQQQYAAGTPVVVWYVLAEPTTGIVNEPLMRIGDYADTVSKSQAGVAIPTNNGSTTVDVDTTVKPSEMYIKYMG